MEHFAIFEMLPEGRENAISRRNLMTVLGMSDRSLRLAIAAERRAGALILSSTAVDGGGYYRPANAEEIARFVSSMERRAKSTFAAVSNARKELKRIEQQEREGWDCGECGNQETTGDNAIL